MTVRESLKAVHHYPIAESAINDIADERALELNEEATLEVRLSSPFKLAKADVILWVSEAPNITEGGISISISEAARERLRQKANKIYEEP